ncbi:LysE family translocator [Dongia deserti]|uniref:LysE family translocator n=1 Tax=Dongia deserti TaxID=2268030 RepID=UPI000E64EECE|nr:LysE family transporter [Dongia deserti]
MLDLLLSQAWVMAEGGGIGFLVAAAIGPIAMLCIRTTLERGRLAGIAAGMGVAVADTVFAAIGAYGISVVGRVLAAGESWLKLAGGLLLITFGIYLARKRPNSAAEDNREVPKSLHADFAMTLVLTLTNPMTVISFAGLFAGISGLHGFALNVIPALLIGVFIGSMVWWVVLAVVIGLIRHKIDSATMLWINRGSGAAIVAFGLYMLVGPVRAFAEPLVAQLMTQ